MNQLEATIVRGKEGLRGTIEPTGVLLNNQVLVRLDNDQQILVPRNMLIRQEDGSYYLPLSLAEVEDQARSKQSSEAVVVPVLMEELQVQKRRVESGGIRIKKVVHEREEIVDEPLLQEELDVKRVPINRPVDGPIPIRYSGNTMIVSLLEEVLVVEKRLMLKEELHISKRQIEAHQPETVIVRSEEAIVESFGTQARERGDDRDLT